MEKTILSTNKDGSINYLLITKENLNDTLIHLHDNFYKNENICKAIRLSEDPKAVEELDLLVKHSVEGGLSLIALEKSTNKIVGALITTIQKNGDTLFEELINSFKQPATKYIGEFLITVESAFNVYENLKIDTLLDLMFLSVDSKYGGRGIGTELCQIMELVIRKLLNGENVVNFPKNQTIPKVFTAIGTTFKTQRIFSKLGYTKGYEYHYKDAVFNNVTLDNLIDKQTSNAAFVYKMLV